MTKEVNEDEITYDDNFVYLGVQLLDFLGFRGDLGEVGFDGSVGRLKLFINCNFYNFSSFDSCFYRKYFRLI